MSASAGPKKQARFHFYDQGQVFALPVDDTWAFGLISRVSKVSPSMFLGHFFPYLWSELPRIEQLPEVTPSDAIYISQVSHLAVTRGDWPVLGRIAGWSAQDWPMPHFGIPPRPLYPVWREEVYDEMDPGKLLRTIRSPDPVAAKDLPEYGSAGSRFAQKRLSRILRVHGGRPFATAPKGTYESVDQPKQRRVPAPVDVGIDLHFEFVSESGQPVSSDEGRRLVEELETALIEVVREPDDVDGVEFGATDGVIFLRGPDCKRMWTIVQPFARACPLRPAHATLHRTVEGVDVKERIDL